jgi:hypothetical protein
MKKHPPNPGGVEYICKSTTTLLGGKEAMASIDLEALLKADRIVPPLGSLEDFIQLTTVLYASGNVIFRGQRRDWPLVPAVGRISFRSYGLAQEQAALDEFKREALPYLHHMPSNNWQWLAVAQHNRLPTRLLDWSKSPLVALWFAVSEPALENHPGVVWAHYYPASEAIYSTVGRAGEPFSIDRPFVYFPEHVFPYIQAQSGVFTVHHRCSEDGQFISFENDVQNSSRNRLTKIQISPIVFPIIRYKLFRLGIHPASLFPGLSGLVDRIKYQNESLPYDDEKELRGYLHP